ncbi:glycosyltransferase family 2 protein [Kribbella sp. CA-294648]|uniref:glycosyltransferase family 2 protein n=1 Tax=Kribbella sp. CA-294648 TaxID=3239948 RepID=UPI003D93951E
MTGQAAVTVVIPTRDRPALLRRAIAAIAAQDCSGPVDVVVVHDGTEPDTALPAEFPQLPITVLENNRTPGLAGSRNTGILATTAPWVAFCDDDDVWLDGKLSAQLAALESDQGAEFCSCSIRVRFGDSLSDRVAGQNRISHQDLLRSRMAMAHSSTFVVARAALLGTIGLLDESIPGSQNEDWDLLLRASSRRPIVHVDSPLVEVLWGRTSFFGRQWETKIDSLEWMLDRYPAIGASGPGAARVYGQLAFASASLGERRRAVGWAIRSVRARWCEPRAFIALAVAGGVVSSETVLDRLHRHGRGV